MERVVVSNLVPPPKREPRRATSHHRCKILGSCRLLRVAFAPITLYYHLGTNIWNFPRRPFLTCRCAAYPALVYLRYHHARRSCVVRAWIPTLQADLLQPREGISGKLCLCILWRAEGRLFNLLPVQLWRGAEIAVERHSAIRGGMRDVGVPDRLP